MKHERPSAEPIRDYCNFFGTYLDSVYDLETFEEQDKALFSLLEYMIYGIVPQDLTGGTAIIFRMAKPGIDKSVSISETRRNAGRKGGKANAKQNKANAKQNKANAKQSGTEIEIEKEIEKEIEEEIENVSVDDCYSEFCRLYPKNERLSDAYEPFARKIEEGESPIRLINAAKEYARECKEKRTEIRFISYAQNFINNGKYKAYADKVEARENKYKQIDGNPFDKYVGYKTPFND